MTLPPSSPPPDFDEFEWGDDLRPPQAGKARSTESAPEPADIPAPSPSPARPAVADRSAEPPVGDSPGAVRPPSFAFRPIGRSSRYDLDPFFLYIVVMSLSLGLTPVAMSSPVGRYAILWSVLALSAAVAVFWRGRDVVLRLHPNELLWGAGWGAAVGLPLLLVGTDLLADASRRIFVGMPDGAVFLTIVFVMTMTETVFFRHLLQRDRSLLVTALMASGWAILLFFPTMDVLGYPFVALIVGTFLVMLNVLYSYVRHRNGLAAAWLCQGIVSLAWLLVPRLIG